MAVLYFSGDQVAFFQGISSSGDNSTFTGVQAPFLATDMVEIVVPDQYIDANGDFKPGEVQFTSVTVVRDGVDYDFGVNSDSKIKETGGGQVPEAGDTFFSTNDQIGPPGSGPFSGLQSGKLVFSSSQTFTTGQNTTIDRTTAQDLNGDGDTSDSGESASGQFNAVPAYSPPCFAPGTLIQTPQGPRPAEDLHPGDAVLTIDHGPQPIRWIRAWPQDLAQARADAKPVLLQAGALGPNLPERDQIVSPQHRILVGGAKQLQGVFPTEGLVAAKVLTMLPKVRHMAGRAAMVWHHFACGQHEVVQANGLWSESLLLGPMVLRGLSPADRLSLREAFPGVNDKTLLNGPPARALLTPQQAKKLLQRDVAAWPTRAAMHRSAARVHGAYGCEVAV